LKLKYNKPLSNAGSEINLRRYIQCNTAGRWRSGGKAVQVDPMTPELKVPAAQLMPLQ
jgi:hypothetical protein